MTFHCFLGGLWGVDRVQGLGGVCEVKYRDLGFRIWASAPIGCWV